MRALRVAGPHAVVAETASARVRAKAAVLALNAATRGVRPLRSRLSVTSSHIVLTEPVPELLEAIGWTGGESITDARTFLHYFRTTPDGRVAFGWGGGRLAYGARLKGRIEVDPHVAAVTHRHLVDYFPALAGRADHARLGRADRRLAEPPAADRHARRRAGALRVRVHRQRRRPVAPRRARARRRSRSARATAASRSSIRPRSASRPSRWRGRAGTSCARALLRAERLQAEGRRPDPLTRAVCAAPRALGIHVGR